jgi:hypothetical protein
MYQRVFKIQPSMFENKLQVLIFSKNIQVINLECREFIHCLHKKTLKALNLHIYIYIYIYIYTYLSSLLCDYIIFSQILNW